MLEDTVTLSTKLFNQLLWSYGELATLNKGFEIIEAIKADVAKRNKQDIPRAKEEDCA